MFSFRNDPDGAANQVATRQNEREIFALRMQAAHDADEAAEMPEGAIDHVPHPYHDGTLSVD